MASRQGEILLNTFLEAAGGEWRGVVMDDLLALLATALEERAAAAAAVGTASRTTSGGGQQASGSGSSAASKVLNAALGMVPVAKALMAIFGGNDDEKPATLVKFALPPALRLEAANRRAGVAGMDYGQEGLPRLAVPRRGAATSAEVEFGLAGETEGSAFEEPAAVRRFGDAPRGAARAPGQEAAAPREAANITIQVQAMDSRSFLDHSAEIAQAVREAMLNMHSLNDVVNDI